MCEGMRGEVRKYEVGSKKSESLYQLIARSAKLVAIFFTASSCTLQMLRRIGICLVRLLPVPASG